MSDRDNGITQTPWQGGAPFATPDVGGTGLNGMGAGLDAGAGGNGITQSPFEKAWPTPGMENTGQRDWPNPPETIVTGGAEGKGSQLPHDITPRNPGYTIDKR